LNVAQMARSEDYASAITPPHLDFNQIPSTRFT